VSETNRTMEERRSTITCPRKGWIRVSTPTEQRDRPDLDLTFRAGNVRSYGIMFVYDHPTFPGVVVYEENGKFVIDNLPLSEFDAAMIKAESCST
jgi:hypothetical protein